MLSDSENEALEELAASLRNEGFGKRLSLRNPRFALLAALTILSLVGVVATFTISTIAALIFLALAYASALVAVRRWLERHPRSHYHEHDGATFPADPSTRY